MTFIHYTNTQTNSESIMTDQGYMLWHVTAEQAKSMSLEQLL